MTRYAAYGENMISAVKYAIATLTIVAGIGVMFTSITPLSGPLGFLYGSRVGLVLFGVLTVLSGLALLYGKVMRSKSWTGIGLMACYCCFLFATIIQGIAFTWVPSAWVANAILAFLTGLLWLRWKFKTSYINPKHFRQDVIDLK